jgi:outer membrane protein TolC
MRRFLDLLLLQLLLACVVCIIGSGTVLAAEEEALESQEPPLTISWVVEEAASNNPDIRASLNRWEASQEAIDVARSLDDPKLGFQLRNEKNPLQFEGGGKRYRRWEETIRIITALAKTAYYGLHYIHKAIDINEGNKDLLAKFAKIAETRYKVGKAPQRDVLAAQVELAKIINDLQVLGEEKRSAETRINTLLNREPEAPLGKPEDYTPHKFSINLEDVEALAVKNRPELKKFGLAVKKNKSVHKLAKKDLYFPDPEVGLHYMQSEVMADSWRSQVGINVPWIWGKHRAKVRETKQTVKAAQADYQAVQNAVLFEVKDVWVKATNARSTAKIYSENVIPLAEQSLKAAITEYKTEKIDFLTLIDSERTLLDAELVYYRALADFETNLAELERAVGIPLTQEGF